jgi:hypothetical protein
MEVMSSLNMDTVTKACRQFWSRVENIVAADSNFIK